MDITMCEGHRCPLRFTCLRFTGKRAEYMQSIFVEPPYVMHGDKAMCDKYWEDKRQKKDEQDKTVLD
jgi:purine nucleoside permease